MKWCPLAGLLRPLLSSFSSLRRRRLRAPGRERIRRFRPLLEDLEDRVVPSSVSGRTCFDTNADGLQDAGEGGAAGVSVALYSAPCGPATATYVTGTTTDSSGYCLFENLADDFYLVLFTAPPPYCFSPPNVGSDPYLDSDVDPYTGQTNTFTLESGQGATNIDAGFHEFFFVMPESTTSLSASASSLYTAQAVTFTAAVASAGGSPTGTVDFYENGFYFASAELSDGLAAWSTNALGVGSLRSQLPVQATPTSWAAAPRR